MFNYHRRDVAVIPHQAIILSNMNQQDVRIVEWVTCIGGVWPGRVMFQVDTRQAALRWCKQLELIFLIILRTLVENEVQIEPGNLFRGYLAHIIGQVEGWSTPAIALGASGLDRQIPVMLNARQRIEVAAMDMPGQNV